MRQWDGGHGASQRTLDQAQPGSFAYRPNSIGLSRMNEEIEQLRQGGESAVADFFSRHRDRLERLVEFRLDPRLRSRVDPGDVLQEAYIEIARRYRDFLEDAKVSFYVWARQITLQVLIDTQRRHFGQKRTPQQEVKFHRGPNESTSGSIAQVLHSQLASPSGVAIRAEEIQQLNIALDSMDEMDREVLALRHFEHLGNSEVAEALGLSVTAASNRYVRAMGRLGEIMNRITSSRE